jgi:hypothetical protein
VLSGDDAHERQPTKRGARRGRPER